MAEWSMAAVLKTVERQRSGGSNPSASASKASASQALFCGYGGTPTPRYPHPNPSPRERGSPQKRRYPPLRCLASRRGDEIPRRRDIHLIVKKIWIFQGKMLHLQSCSEQGRSSAGLERFSHIEEVIGSNPIVPTKPLQKDVENDILFSFWAVSYQIERILTRF